MTHTARYAASTNHDVADGWTLERLIAPSRLFGANGLRTGPDGRIYIAQVAGSTISALDLDSATLDTVTPMGGDIIAPDDVAFAANGDMYITEYYDGRVSVRESGGATRLLRDDLPGANGITIHRDRLFVNECRPGGRLMELDLAGGPPRILLDNLPMPNGMEVGPDGKLYYPLLGANEIWRIDLDGGEPEKVADNLGGPDAVKFDPAGNIVSTQVATGQVLRIDPRTGAQTVLAQLEPGLDNLTFAGERLFVSGFTGQITEILADGGTRVVLDDGLTWPLDIAAGPDGTVYIADGMFLLELRPGGRPTVVSMAFHPGYPGYIRGIATAGEGEFLVTGNGSVSRYRPADATSEILVDGLDQTYGVAVSPRGSVVAADLGGGAIYAVTPGHSDLMAEGLDRPVGVAFTADGTCLVSESGAGRVVAINDSGVDTVIDGLETPHGILVRDNELLVLDAGAKALVAYDLDTKSRTTIAQNLPVGAPAGVSAKPLAGIEPFSGPQGPFAGITAGPDGTVFLSCDGDGSILAARRKA